LHTQQIKPLTNFKMFSKILTVGLAALIFVGAAPATDFQAPMAISCNVNVPVNSQSDICVSICCSHRRGMTG
jgi:hypothetical protein